MSAKKIANTYVQQLNPIAITIELRDYKMFANGESLEGFTMSGLRHNWFSNYTEVCLALDSEAANHSRLYFENIKSKFKELVNNLVLDMLVQANICR